MLPGSSSYSEAFVLVIPMRESFSTTPLYSIGGGVSSVAASYDGEKTKQTLVYFCRYSDPPPPHAFSGAVIKGKTEANPAKNKG